MPSGRPTRILCLIDELDIGGTEQQILELLKELDRSRFEPHVACFRDKGRIAAEIEKLGVPVTLVAKQARLDVLFLQRLTSFIKGVGPDIVQTYLFTANTWGRLAARRAGVQVVIAGERNVDDWKGPVHNTVDRWMARLSNAIVANASAIRDFMVRGQGLQDADIRVIYNGVRWQRFKPDLSRALGGKSPLLGIVGRLEAQKDHVTCLEAFALVLREVPGARLRVIGDGSLRPSLEKRAQELGIAGAVEFAGATRDIAAALAPLDLLVLSSTREGCANVILEAMAAGVPVVATNVGGNPDLVTEGETGLLVPARDPAALGRAITQALSDPARLSRWAAKGVEEARGRFSIEAMVEAHQKLYQELLSKPRRIVYVIDDLALGGAQRQLLELLGSLPRDRFVPEVIALSNKKTALVDAVKKAGVPLTILPHTKAISFQTFGGLWRLMRASRPDVVHTWLFTADLYGRVAARFARVPVIMSAVRSVDEDKPRHYVYVDRVLRHITDSFTVNAAAIGQVLQDRDHVPASQIHTIYNGVDLTVFDPQRATRKVRDRLALPADTFIVGAIGRLSPEKGQATLIDAAARVRKLRPEVRFLIVGDGPEGDALKERARAAGLDGTVIFMAAQRPVTDVYGALDLLVVPSTFEGCSNVLLEAMAMRLPVVATAVGGNPELVTPGVNGLLVPRGNPDLLASAIVELASDRSRALSFGAAGRKLVEERYTLGTMVDRTAAFYDERLAAKNHPRPLP